MKRRICPSSPRRCWRSAGNLFSISVTNSGRLAAVEEISRTLFVCFWNAFGNKTLTDIAFSYQPERFIHCVALFHKVFEIGQPRTDGLILFIRVLQAIGSLQAVTGNASDSELAGFDAAMRIEPRGHGGSHAARSLGKHTLGFCKLLDGRNNLHVGHILGPSARCTNGARCVR